MVFVAQGEGSAGWVVARLAGDRLAGVRLREPDGGGLHAAVGLSRGGGHALICTRVDRGAAPSVGVTSRHRVDALFEG